VGQRQPKGEPDYSRIRRRILSTPSISGCHDLPDILFSKRQVRFVFALAGKIPKQ
jgi:hypothetical protein